MKKNYLNTCSLFAAAVILTPAVQAVTLLPVFDTATFINGAAIDNPYFNATNQATRTYQGTKEEDGEIITESFQFSYGGLGPTLMGVQTQILRDRAFEDGVIVEDTFDYYAQDSDGNVWYFGEDVTNYVYDDGGNLVETNDSSSWLAGVNDALPGFIMPALDALNVEYFQEFAPNDDAVDKAQTFATGLTVAIDFGTFQNVRQVLETNPLDPDSVEFKYYAYGVGLILVEDGLDGNFANPEISVALISTTPVPVPAALPLLSSALAGLSMLTRRRNRSKTKV